MLEGELTAVIEPTIVRAWTALATDKARTIAIRIETRDVFFRRFVKRGLPLHTLANFIPAYPSYT
jgi:hypothetical protein